MQRIFVLLALCVLLVGGTAHFDTGLAFLRSPARAQALPAAPADAGSAPANVTEPATPAPSAPTDPAVPAPPEVVTPSAVAAPEANALEPAPAVVEQAAPAAPAPSASGVQAPVQEPTHGLLLSRIPASEAETLALAEATRADAWIEAMQRKEREKRIGGRWMSTIASAGIGTGVTVLLAIDEPSEMPARAILGASLAPFVAGAALGLFLPEEHATPWATTAFLVGMATASASLGFAWGEADLEATRSERQALAFSGGALAAQFAFLIPMAFLDRGVGKRAYSEYFALPASERPRAATRLLIESDQRSRAKAGIALLSGLLIMGAVGIGAAVTQEPVALIGGLPTLTSTLYLVPFLFKESRLEMFMQGQMPIPGVFNF